MPSFSLSLSSSLLALAALASTTYAAAPSNASTGTHPYTLVADYSGSNFFDGFLTYTAADPTHGKVNYTDMAFAAKQGYLAYNFHEQDNVTRARIGVDSVEDAQASGRNSVRLTSKKTFNAGTLLVADINHIPVGPGLWPALWLLGTGDNWPARGEIDILEFVHDTPYNSMTLHTAPGCTVDNATSFTGQLQGANCNEGAGTQGCGVHAPDTTSSLGQTFASAGHALNKQGGAIYVTEWTSSGIKIWAFARNAVPASLNDEHPSTAAFPVPLAAFSGKGCDFATAFQDMTLIINTDFCGDWAGKVWSDSGAQKATGVDSCDAYVAQNPEKFTEAFWEIASIKVYASEKMPGVNPDVGKEGFIA
jgi:beta-glucanase (GH16 family)